MTYLDSITLLQYSLQSFALLFSFHELLRVNFDTSYVITA